VGIALFAKFIAQKECGFDLPRIKLSAGRPNPLTPALGLHCPASLYDGRWEEIINAKLPQKQKSLTRGTHIEEADRAKSNSIWLNGKKLVPGFLIMSGG
jgi:hypothetical protein